MKRLMSIGTAILVLGLSMAMAQDEKEEDPGKTIFKNNKCQSCHSIEAAGMKKKPNQKPPDLSAVGSKHEAAFLAAFLKKKEAINDKKHAISFKGSDEELETLVQWLVSLKDVKN